MAKELSKLYVVIGARTQEFTKAMNDTRKQLALAGAAMTAVGAAGLKLSADARKLNAELGQTALTVGVSTREMRQLALETTNVTFGLESVAATFDLLARAGMRNTDEIRKSATAFDALGDATFTSAEFVAALLIPAFKLFGEAIPTTSQELDRFTWLVKNTTVDLSDFGTLLTRMAPYMDQLNMSMDDAVAILAALAEQGIQGTAATLKLRTAITQAASTGQNLNDILGITQEELNRYRQEMRGATGITDEYAKVANRQFGVMDKLKQKWKELAFQLGSFLTPLEPVLAAMTALGPAMIMVGLKGKALMAFFTVLKAKMLAVQIQAVAMWGAITLGVAAAIIGIVALVQNWERVDAFLRGPAYRAAKNLEAALAELGATAKRVGITVAQELTRASSEVQNTYKRMIDFLSTGAYEKVEFLTDEELLLIRQVAPAIADTIEASQTLARELSAAADTIDRQVEAQEDLNRLTQIEQELVAATGLERDKLLAEQQRLQARVYVREWKGIVREHAATIASALGDQLTGWEQHFEDIKRGYDGTVEYIKNTIIPAINRALAEGLITPDVAASLKQSIEGMKGELAGVEAETRQAQREYYDATRETGGAQEWATRTTPIIYPDFMTMDEFKKLGLKDGGIVTAPTMALIGEAGPEAVIPLPKLESGSGEVHVHLGNLIGDEMSMRKFVRMLGEMQGQEGRRNAFGQVNKGYFYGRSSV